MTPPSSNRANVGATIDRTLSQIHELQRANASLERDLDDAKRELAIIRSGTGWRMLEAIRRLRVRALPHGTLRDRLFRKMLVALDAASRLGAVPAIRRLARNPKRFLAVLRATEPEAPGLNQQYQVWLEQHRLTPKRLRMIGADMETFTSCPVISILMPVFNIQEEWLRGALESVRQQIYPHWTLCIVDDASTAAHVRPLLESFAAEDSRIKVRRLEMNEGISGASNQALSFATGEFVGLLDHDDRLAPDALYEVVRRLNADPLLDFIYSDHDIQDGQGQRIGPLFKPDWSPDLLLSMNYITHFCVYRRTLVEQIGGFRKGLEGSQDYDLILRVTEKTHRIAHIPKPLYSWCQAPTSVAHEPGAKPYAHEAGRRALGDALVRRGIAGEVLDGYGAPYRYRVKRTIVGNPKVSILIPSRDNRRLLQRCVESIEDKSAYRSFEIIVIDNESRDPRTVEYLESLSHRVLPFSEPFNFARMNNVAAREATGDYLLFLNDDTEVIEPGWLGSLLEHAQRREVGAVGARLLFPDRTIQHAGVLLGIQGRAGHAFWGFPADHPGYYDFARVVRNYSAVTGACLMTSRAVFEEVAGFDESFEISYNDVDLCLRMRERGYLIVYTPYAVLYHHQSASRGPYDAEKDRKYEELLRDRWKHIFEHGDPYYNPHLTLSTCDFSLRI